MFICPECNSETPLPRCKCGYEFKCDNGIWRLSDAPDAVTDGDGDKYIGYEHIGESYSGDRRFTIEKKDQLVANAIAEETGYGIFLDLACGDGCFTVPCASLGTRIIAGDISTAMLSILRKKAEYNRVLLENVTLCRMNALELPLADESVDTVVASSVLHLISSPEKVVHEIHRVLKNGGKFICVDDRPGVTGDGGFDNARYLEIVNFLYSEYWKKLAAKGISPKKYSWRFDRAAFCDTLFSKKRERLITLGDDYEIRLGDGFLPRFTSRAFSDQFDVPQELHTSVIDELTTLASSKFGDDFADTPFRGVEDDILLTVYSK